MKESEATIGTKLHALMVAGLMGVSMQTILYKWTDQSDISWDELALEIQRDTLNSLPELRDILDETKAGG